MNETNKFALLRDLAHLLRKYGPGAFSDLASFLKNPERIADLTKILEAADSAGRKSGVPESGVIARQAKDSRASVLHLLSKLEREEPQKAQMLSGFYEALTGKRALPTLRELRSFAHDNGLNVVTARSRDKAISPLMRDLAARPIDDIRSILKRVRTTDGAIGDRSLEGWTNVILNKRSQGSS